jgi:hypothetical protein
MEKSSEYGMDLRIIYVDLRRAFDGVSRNNLYEAMEQKKLPDKLIGLTQMTLNVTEVNLKIDNKLSVNLNVMLESVKGMIY